MAVSGHKKVFDSGEISASTLNFHAAVSTTHPMCVTFS